MAITKPMLPPKAGYVEVEVDGVRRYRNVKTGEIFGEETIPTTDARVATLEAQLAESDEAAIALFEAQTAQEAIDAEQDEAILALYEMVGG